MPDTRTAFQFPRSYRLRQAQTTYDTHAAKSEAALAKFTAHVRNRYGLDSDEAVAGFFHFDGSGSDEEKAAAVELAETEFEAATGTKDPRVLTAALEAKAAFDAIQEERNLAVLNAAEVIAREHRDLLAGIPLTERDDALGRFAAEAADGELEDPSGVVAIGALDSLPLNDPRWEAAFRESVRRTNTPATGEAPAPDDPAGWSVEKLRARLDHDAAMGQPHVLGNRNGVEVSIPAENVREATLATEVKYMQGEIAKLDKAAAKSQTDSGADDYSKYFETAERA